MTGFLAIVEITIREFVRSKVMIVLLIIGVLFVLFFACCSFQGSISQQGYELSGSEKANIFLAICFRILAVFGVLGTVFLSMNSLAYEIQSKRATLILTHPISRTDWLLAKTVGTWLTVALDTTVLFILCYGLTIFKLKEFFWQPFAGFCVLLAVLFILTLFVIVLSVLLPAIASGFLTLIIYAISWVMSLDWVQAYFFLIDDYFTKPESSWAGMLAQIIREPPSLAAQIFYWFIYILVPHFGNVQGIGLKITSRSPVGLAMDWWSILFLTIYALLFVVLGHHLLKRKEF